jgi:hypothetical protein
MKHETMKTLLFALVAFIAVFTAAPVAEAGQFARVYTRHGVVYAHKSQLYSPYAYGYRGHRHHYRSYAYRPYYRNYYRRNYVSYPYYSDYGYYRPAYGYYRPAYNYYQPYYCGHHYRRPHISVAFGF